MGRSSVPRVRTSSASICSESSRVGATISVYANSFWIGSRLSIGSPYASVFPDPVIDSTTASRPDATTGITVAWIAVGPVKPCLRHAYRISGRRLSDVNDDMGRLQTLE